MVDDDRAMRAWVLMEAGRLDDAERLAKRILATDPDEVTALLTLTQVGHKRADHEGTRRAAQRLITAHPDNPHGHGALSSALVQLGRFTEAVDAAQRYVALAPDMAEAHATLAMALARILGRTTDALRAAERALRLDPESSHAWVTVSGVYTLARQDPQAVDAAERAVAFDPTNALFRVVLGGVYLQSGRDTDGVQQLRAALSEEPTRFLLSHAELALLWAAVPAAARGLYDEVCTALRHPDMIAPATRVTDPSLVSLRCGYAQALGERHHDEAARQILSAVLRDVPGDQTARMLSAVLCEHSGDMVEAVRLSEDLLAEGLAECQLHHTRTHSYQRLRRFTEALAALDDAMTACPYLAEFPLRRAQVLVEIGRDAEALDSVRRAMQLDPSDQEARSLLHRLHPTGDAGPGTPDLAAIVHASDADPALARSIPPLTGLARQRRNWVR